MLACCLLSVFFWYVHCERLWGEGNLHEITSLLLFLTPFSWARRRYLLADCLIDWNSLICGAYLLQ